MSHRPWRSRWIWAHPAPVRIVGTDPVLDDAEAAAVVLLRRVVVLDEVPGTAPARVTADSRYVLHVNGEEVARGPVRGDPTLLRFDEVDLAPWLRPGENVLAVVAQRYPAPNAWWRPAPTTFGLGGGSFVFDAQVGDEVVVSDASWRAFVDSGRRMASGRGISHAPIEIADRRVAPRGWELPGFDDAAWTAAAELSTNHVGWSGSAHPPTLPYGPLLPRPIPQLTARRHPAVAVTVHALGPAEVVADTGVLDPLAVVDRDDAACGVGEAWSGPSPLPRDGDGRVAALVRVDLGEEVAGTVVVELRGPAGTVVCARMAEGVRDDGRLDPIGQESGFGAVTAGTDALDEPERLETLDPIGGRHLALSIRAGGPGEVTLHGVEVVERVFPGVSVSSRPRPHDAVPFFECSDPLLEEVFLAGRRTVDLCSHDAYLDCPSREQRAWTGDSVVHQMVDLTTNLDWSLARWHPQLAASPRSDGMLPMAVGGDFEHADLTYIPDWGLHWVHSVHNLWRYTGDDELVGSLLPVAERLLRWFLPFRDDDGVLVDVTGWLIVDWAAVGTAGASGAINALWGRALAEFAEMADDLSDAGRAAWAWRCWEELRHGFRRFWDDSRGLYVDEVVDGVARPAVSQHTNAAAIVARLTADEVDRTELAERIVDRSRVRDLAWLKPGHDAVLSDDGDMYAEGGLSLVFGHVEPWWDTAHDIVAAQPFFRYVVHDAVAAAGRADLLPELCRDWKRLLDRCPTTLSEVWYGGSHCHGWSATPTRDLIQHTLGITPGTPGFGTVRVRPNLGDLAWARGAAPTPHGLVHVEVSPDEIRVSSPVRVEVHPHGHYRPHTAVRLERGDHVVAR